MWLQHYSIVLVFVVFVLIVVATYWPGRKSADRAAWPHSARRRSLRSATVPTKIEKDVVTGQDTTGHEWDGLKELNTPLPKWWLYVFYATIVWAVGMVRAVSVGALGITGYFHGVLGYSQRAAVDADVRAVVAQRAGTMDRIEALSFADIRKDPQLHGGRRAPAGRIAFANNCQPCHGAGGGGQSGLSGAGGRRLDLGRHARRDPADHHLRHPQRRSRRRAKRRCRASAPTAC